jgi:pectin lyase
LTDDEARVIVINGTFDYTDPQGTTTSARCKKTAGCGNGYTDQETITDTCDDTQTAIEITYYTAAKNPIAVASNKSLVGSGDSAVIKGRGLILEDGVSNIIIQTIFLTVSRLDLVWTSSSLLHLTVYCQDVKPPICLGRRPSDAGQL